MEDGSGEFAGAGAATGAARARARKRKQGEYSFVSGESGRGNRDQGQHAREYDGAGSAQRGTEPERGAVDGDRPRKLQRARDRAAAARGCADAAIYGTADRRALFQVGEGSSNRTFNNFVFPALPGRKDRKKCGKVFRSRSGWQQISNR